MNKLLYYIRKKASGFFILGNFYRPINPFKTTLLYWKQKGGIDNVGDYLSVVVVENVLKHFGLKRHFKLYPRRLSAIGSILSFIGSGKTTVWGSGLMTADSVSSLLDKTKNVKLDVRALRGPLTGQILDNNSITPPPTAQSHMETRQYLCLCFIIQM